MDKEQCTKAAAGIAGHKMFVDYIGLSLRGIAVEPESFCDKWIAQTIQGATEEFKSEIWNFFVRKLIEEKAKRGK